MELGFITRKLEFACCSVKSPAPLKFSDTRVKEAFVAVLRMARQKSSATLSNTMYWSIIIKLWYLSTPSFNKPYQNLLIWKNNNLLFFMILYVDQAVIMLYVVLAKRARMTLFRWCYLPAGISDSLPCSIHTWLTWASDSVAVGWEEHPMQQRKKLWNSDDSALGVNHHDSYHVLLVK